MCRGMLQRLVLASLLTVTLLTLPNPAQSYEAELTALAGKLMSQLEAANQKTGTVHDFTALDETPTSLGRFLAIELSDQLVSVSQRMKFVDRTKLQHLLREHNLSAEGVLSPESIKKLGNLAGIDTFVFGTAIVLGDNIRLSVRATATETAIIVASQSTLLPKHGLIAFLGGASGSPGGVPGSTVMELVTECDRLAAHPGDLKRLKEVAGIETSQIDVARAGPACDNAIRQYPGVARFIYQSGRVAYVRRDYAVARQHWEQAAASGYVRAIGAVGVLYLRGEGVSQDFGAARERFERAAASGDAVAMISLGTMYKDGRGVRQDAAEARRWLEKAVALGDADAKRLLGEIPVSLRETLSRPDSFKVVSNFYPPNKLNFTIENLSGLAVGIGVLAHGTSAGPCSGGSEVRGLPHVLPDSMSGAGFAGYMSDVYRNPNLLTFLPIGGKVSGTVEFDSCDRSAFSGLDSIPVTVTVVLAAERAVKILPLSSTLRARRN